MSEQYGQNKISIGVSSCLLGESSRYDGGHKKSATILSSLCSVFSCVSFCPEIAVGLGVPRDPIRLTLDTQHRVRAIMPGNQDVTENIQQYVTDIKLQLAKLSGFVLKSKSPSCGVQSTELFVANQGYVQLTSGIFTARLRDLFPTLPLCEETDLQSTEDVNKFISKVIQFQSEKRPKSSTTSQLL